MKRFLQLAVLCLVLGTIWHIYGEPLKKGGIPSALEEAKHDITGLKDSPKVQETVQKFRTELDSLSAKGSQKFEWTARKPDLNEPESQAFSIYNIEIGDTKADVEKQAGKAKRISMNEYGVEWNAYHENYQNFFMAAYKDGKVAGLYTNQDLISSKSGISLETPKADVIKKLGNPSDSIRKGHTIYQLQQTEESGLYFLDSTYITIFYDKYEGDTVTAVQIISTDLENAKNGFYAKGSKKLEEGFEDQLFDLTNAARVTHELSPLKQNNEVQGTARGHSTDMAENNYFNHTNLKGESPFERMEDDGIRFHTAGENLAAGQMSSVFAHEGLMNSLGHRKNILQKDFKELGTGVAFNSEQRPYYTENFLTK